MQLSTTYFPIVQRQEIADGVIEVVCKNEHGFSFKAGQYVNVTLDNLKYPDPRGKTRTFNIVSSPNNTEYIGFSFLQSNSGFKKTLSEIQPNSKIEIKGAFGTFTLPEEYDRPIVFIADGIGITPCLSIAIYAAEERLPHKITMIYTGKKIPAYLASLQEVEKLNQNFKIISKTNSVDAKFLKKSVSDIKNAKWFIAGTSHAVTSINQAIRQLEVSEKDIKIEEFSGYS